MKYHDEIDMINSLYEVNKTNLVKNPEYEFEEIGYSRFINEYKNG